MHRRLLTICTLSVALLASACGSDSTPAASTAAATTAATTGAGTTGASTTGAGGTATTTPGGGGSAAGPGTASVDVGGDKIDFTGISCAVPPDESILVVDATSDDASFRLTTDDTTAGRPIKGGGKFDKFAVTVSKGASIVAVVGGSLNLAPDLQSGDFSGKDSASSRTVSGKFAC